MPLFENPFSMEIPIRIGTLNTIFFINNNLLVNNEECASDPHCHHDFEIRYLVSGDCNQIINRKNYLLRTGQLLLIHPQEYHYQKPNNNSTQYNIRFSLIAPSPTDTVHQKNYENCLYALMKLRQLDDEQGVLRSYLDRLMQEIYHKEEGFHQQGKTSGFL